MGKKASKKIGVKKKKSYIESPKQSPYEIEKNKKEFEEKLLNLSDEEIERLFEEGKINQEEYEYILGLKKKKKQRAKSQKEKFEERIRCNNTIIEKVISLGKKFRRQELDASKKRKEQDTINKLLLEMEENEIDEPDIERGERLRDNNSRMRQRERENLSRNRGGRDRERDR